MRIDMKKPIAAIAALLLLVCLTACSGGAFQNGGFEEGGTVPAGWSYSAWKSATGSVESLAHGGDALAEGGNLYVKLTNAGQNKTMLSQKVKVEKGAYYRLSGYIRVDVPITSAKHTFSGAHLGIKEDSYAPSKTYKDTGGVWKYYETYFMAEYLTEVTVEVRLGSDDRDCVGTACFDNVAVEKVTEEAAAGASVITARPDGRTGMTVLASLGGFAFIAAATLAVLFFAGKLFKGKRLPGSFWAVLVLAVALALRVLIAATTAGYGGDLACFRGWAEHLAERGPWNFYGDYAEANALADYVPGYLYVLWLLGGAGKLFSLSAAPMNVLLRFPSILTDLLSAFLIYRIARRKLGETPAVVFSALIALNPFVIANSAWWGQVESVVTLFTLLSFDAALRKRPCASLVWFAVGVFFKFQMVFALPVYLAYLAYEFVRHKRLRLPLLATVALCFAGFYAASLPFTVHEIAAGDALFPFRLYFRQIATYNYYTMNAFNVYGLFGLNMIQMESPGAMTAVSYALIALFSAGAAFLLFYAKDKGLLPLIAGVLYAAVYLFSVKMHERYLYTGAVLLIVSYLWCRDIRVLALSLGLGLVHFLDLAGVMLSETRNFVNGSFLWSAGCALSLLLFAGLVWVTIDIARKRNRKLRMLLKNGRDKERGAEARTPSVPE